METECIRVVKNQMLSNEYPNVVQADGRAKNYDELGLRDRIMVQCEHDVVGVGRLRNWTPLRIRSTQIMVYLEHKEAGPISKATMMPASGAHQILIQSLMFEDLDYWIPRNVCAAISEMQLLSALY